MLKFFLCLPLLILLFPSTSLLAQSSGVGFVVDGVLDDPVWRGREPEMLRASYSEAWQQMGGEFRSTIVGRHFYLGARLPEPSGRITARVTGRNPNWEDEDLLKIVAGPDIGYTDREVKINPLGAYSVERNGEFVHLDADQYLVATRVADREWIVELSFPLNLVSAPSSDRFLFSVERIRAARPGVPQLRWHWPESGPVAKASVTSDDWNLPAPSFRPLGFGGSQGALEIGRVRDLPPLESGWEENHWADTQAFQLLRNEPLARLPHFPTRVKFLHDGEYLAILAECQEPLGILAPPSDPAGRPAPEDSFSVYLATSGSAYAQLSINPLGHLRAYSGMTGGSRVSRPRAWRSGARFLVRQTSENWTLRIDIPLLTSGRILGETKLPREWRLLCFRSRPGRSGEPQELSVLPVIQSDTPRCPARYLRVVLTEEPPGVSQDSKFDTPGAPLPPFETRVLSPEQRRQWDLAGMLERHLRRRVQKISEEEDTVWAEIRTLQDWERFRDPRLKALIDSIGPFPSLVGETAARVTKEFSGSGYRRQDLLYLSRPGLWVTANLYLPADLPVKMPGIVIVHSHHRPRTQAELQDMGILWARVGCAVLIMDQIGHGERIQNYPWNRDTYHSRAMIGMQMYLAGESLIKWMVGDIRRGIDLLLERGDIDPDRIILLGAVAGGGDPAAVAAALDPRIAAVAPFNFVRTGARWGEWESTRCLRRSIVDRFFPWVIDASVAPRRLIYANEMGWENYANHEAWERYQRVFAFYGAPHHLDEAHGLGTFPGPGECSNIGPDQRRTLYPELNRWFRIPVPPSEPQDRRPESELAALTPQIASELQMKKIHELLMEVAEEKLGAARAALQNLSPGMQREKLKVDWAEKLGDIEPSRDPEAILRWQKKWEEVCVEGLTLETEPGIIVPLLLLRPACGNRETEVPVVVAVSQGGKERILGNRLTQLKELLSAGIAVCVPDVRGIGETSPDPSRGPDSEETTLSATEFMLGNTLLGSRLKDLRTVLAYLRSRSDLDVDRIGLWGDSPAPSNPERLLLDEIPSWQIGPVIQQQAEPLGSLLALLAGLYEEQIRVVAACGGLVSYQTVLADNFVYVPNDVIVPGILEVGDICDVIEVLAPKPTLLQALVDGRNRLVPLSLLRSELAAVYKAYQHYPQLLKISDKEDASILPAWFKTHLR